MLLLVLGWPPNLLVDCVDGEVHSDNLASNEQFKHLRLSNITVPTDLQSDVTHGLPTKDLARVGVLRHFTWDELFIATSFLEV